MSNHKSQVKLNCINVLFDNSPLLWYNTAMNTKNVVEDIVSLPIIPEDLTSKQVKAVRYLASGISPSTVSQMIGVSYTVIAEWLKDEKFISTVERVANSAAAVRSYAQEAQALSWIVLQQSLAIDWETASPSERRAAIAAAKTVLSTPQLGYQDRNEDHEPQMNITGGSVDAIARRVTQLQQGTQSAASSGISGKFNTEDSDIQFAVHPDTDIGAINVDDETGKKQCHICGKWVVELSTHSIDTHGVPWTKYKSLFGV